MTSILNIISQGRPVTSGLVLRIIIIPLALILVLESKVMNSFLISLKAIDRTNLPYKSESNFSINVTKGNEKHFGHFKNKVIIKKNETSPHQSNDFSLQNSSKIIFEQKKNRERSNKKKRIGRREKRKNLVSKFDPIPGRLSVKEWLLHSNISIPQKINNSQEKFNPLERKISVLYRTAQIDKTLPSFSSNIKNNESETLKYLSSSISQMKETKQTDDFINIKEPTEAFKDKEIISNKNERRDIRSSFNHTPSSNDSFRMCHYFATLTYTKHRSQIRYYERNVSKSRQLTYQDNRSRYQKRRSSFNHQTKEEENSSFSHERTNKYQGRERIFPTQIFQIKILNEASKEVASIESHQLYTVKVTSPTNYTSPVYLKSSSNMTPDEGGSFFEITSGKGFFCDKVSPSSVLSPVPFSVKWKLKELHNSLFKFDVITFSLYVARRMTPVVTLNIPLKIDERINNSREREHLPDAEKKTLSEELKKTESLFIHNYLSAFKNSRRNHLLSPSSAPSSASSPTLSTSSRPCITCGGITFLSSLQRNDTALGKNIQNKLYKMRAKRTLTTRKKSDNGKLFKITLRESLENCSRKANIHPSKHNFLESRKIISKRSTDINDEIKISNERTGKIVRNNRYETTDRNRMMDKDDIYGRIDRNNRIEEDAEDILALSNLFLNKSFSTSNTEKVCGTHWVYFQGTCYKLVPQKLPWTKAEKKCVELGGHLASVSTYQISMFINNIIQKSVHASNPSEAFWIGASDEDFENAFTWTSENPFFYSDWFPGWPDQNSYSSQPSDDGLSDEDCVELRRSFRLSTKGIRLTPRYYWNDRSCRVMNKFICEKYQKEDHQSLEKIWSCNKTINVIAGAPPILVTSPGFPSSYPSKLNCFIVLRASSQATITVLFDAFKIEDHPKCSYDLLQIYEPGTDHSKIICGDWSGKLKLLRFVSTTPQVILNFRTDPAHTYPGFKVRVTAASGEGGCGTQWQIRHGSTCLLAANDPQVTWGTASKICSESQGKLVTLDDKISLSWLNVWLHNHPRFRPDDRYWIGGQLISGSWVWEDGKPVPRYVSKEILGNSIPDRKIRLCLSVEEALIGNDKHFWSFEYSQKYKMKLGSISHFCDGFGGYICMKQIKESFTIENRTILGTEGNVTSPNYPDNYPNDIDVQVRLEGPPFSRLVLTISKLSLEFQSECLYDYVGFSIPGEEEGLTKFCGHQEEGPKPVFVSTSNKASVTFHSDWSERGRGMVVNWKAVDISGCPFKEINESSSVVVSPNYPHFNLPYLDCTTIIRGPEGKRIWIQFEFFDLYHIEMEEAEMESKENPELWKDLDSLPNFDLLEDRFFDSSILNDSYSTTPSEENSLYLTSPTSIPLYSEHKSGNFSVETLRNFTKKVRYDNEDHQSFERQSDTSRENNGSKRRNKRASPSRYFSYPLLTPLPFPLSSSSSISSSFSTSSSSSAYSFSPSFPSSSSYGSKTLDPLYTISADKKDGKGCFSDFLEIKLSEVNTVVLCNENVVEDPHNLAFISHSNVIKILYRTSKQPGGKGFKLHYKIENSFVEETVIKLKGEKNQIDQKESETHQMLNVQKQILPLNYPFSSSLGVKFTRHLVAELGNRITVNVHHIQSVAPHGKHCSQSYLEIEDWYAGKNGTVWKICSFDQNSVKKISITSILNSLLIREIYVAKRTFKKHSDRKLFLPLIKDEKYVNLKHSPSEINSTIKFEKNENLLTSFKNSSKGSKLSEKLTKRETASSSTNNNSLNVPLLSGKNETKYKNIFQNNSSSFSDVKSDFNYITLFENTKNTPDMDNLPQSSTVATDSPNYIRRTESSASYDYTKNFHSFEKDPMKSDDFVKLEFKISYNVLEDLEWINRTLGLGEESELIRRTGVSSCNPSPCLHAGRCVTHGNQHSCVCLPSYTGIFCQVLWCDVDPCIMGRCHISTPEEGYKCKCEPGWGGTLCEKKVSPCAKQPCQGRGECTVVNNTFHCRCHAWWEGPRCQNRIRRIPYKPLSERMIKEPFWLGLITVAIVMGCIGIVFCIKKHFAEKIEKFFAEEIERSMSCSRPNPIPSPTGLSPIPRPKSLLVRLNSFRKASLLSLSSTASSPQCEAPSFTFDDLLKPSKRAGGSSSPRRNLSKPHSQNVSPRIDSKKILRHLVTPPVGHRTPSFDDFLNLRCQNSKCSVISDEFRRLRSASPEVPPSHFNQSTSSANASTSVDVERTLSADISELRSAKPHPDRRSSGEDNEYVNETSLISLVPSPTKQDKKVTFAKLMEKMQKELSSSSSDISTEDKSSSSRPPVFPCINPARRSPRRSPRLKHTTRFSGSGSAGSEEIAETPDVSSSEMTPDPPKRLFTMKSSSSPSSKTSSPQNRSKLTKISSADSLLSMFKSIGGTARSSLSSPTSPHGSEMDDSSAQGSPSTTPTTPPKIVTNPAPKDTLLVPGSLQVQVHGQVGVSQSSGPSITLEVPSEQYRCLSPITELPTPMPTPMPSPLPTPSKYHHHHRQVNTSSESSTQENTTEDTESEFSINISAERSSSDSSGSEPKGFFHCMRDSSNNSSNMIKDNLLHPKRTITIPKINIPSRSNSPSTSPVSSPKVKTKPPPLSIPNSSLLNFKDVKKEVIRKEDNPKLLPVIRIQDEEGGVLEHFDSTPRTRSQSVDVGVVMKTPLITVSCIDDSPPSSSGSSSKSDPSTSSFIVPTLSVTIASPPAVKKNFPMIPELSSTFSCNFSEKDTDSRQLYRNKIRCSKPNNVNSPLVYQTPMITVTASMSEADSDLDTPLEKTAPSTTTARFLSPLLAANVQATSDGNLSSSGYSSAYSSGPSRCSSNNRLSSGEGEEPLTPSATSIQPKTNINMPSHNSQYHQHDNNKTLTHEIVRTDSETADENETSQVTQPDQDSALELDTNDELQDSADEDAESIVDICDHNEDVKTQRHRLVVNSPQSFSKDSSGLSKVTPSIVVQGSLQSESSLEECPSISDKVMKTSPVSSRSESPISDSRLSVHRIYPAFFSSKGKLDLPFTDSDGLYDCPSCEILPSDSSKQIQVRKHGRKKTRKSSKLKSFIDSSRPSTGKGDNKRVLSLELPTWEPRNARKVFQKKRSRTQASAEILSSSSESFTSQSAIGDCSSPIEILSDIGYHEKEDIENKTYSSKGRRRRPLVRGESISCRSLQRQSYVEGGSDEDPDMVTKQVEEFPRYRKFSRFRSFGNQLKFIRRLQASRIRKEKLVSNSGSSESEGDDDQTSGSKSIDTPSIEDTLSFQKPTSVEVDDIKEKKKNFADRKTRSS